MHALEYPSTVPALLARARRDFGGELAVVDDDERITFAELAQEVDRAADALRTRGIGVGDVVGIWAPNSLRWIVASLAIHQVGGVVLPLNTRSTGHEVHELLLRSRAKALMLRRSFLGRDYFAEVRRAAGDAALAHVDLVIALDVDTDSAPPGVVRWDDLVDRVGRPVAGGGCEVVTDEMPADIIFTSGTTGKPKGVVSTHAQTVGVSVAWAARTGARRGDRFLLINPFSHVAGYKTGIVTCLATGAAMYPQETFDVRRALELMASEGITVLSGPPTVLQSILDDPARPGADELTWRIAVVGAATVPVRLIERLYEELALETILTAYGLTEAVVVSMCRPGDRPDLVASTAGTPVAGVEVRVRTASGATAEPDVSGEIEVRGPHVMQGYFDDERATNAAFGSDGWFRTGDVGRLSAEGYLTITDRLKDMYTVGGFNVYPAEIEHVLSRLPGVADSAVVGVPSPRLGFVGHAYVVAQPGAHLTEEEVRSFLKERIANYKVPAHIALVGGLPRNATGKVLKRGLRERAESQDAPAAQHPRE